MDSKIKTVLLFPFLIGLLGNAQDRTGKKAREEIESYAYHEAIDTYESLIAKGYSDAVIFKDLGNAYYLNARYTEAAKWYRRLFRLKNVDLDTEAMYRYAQSLKSNGEYDEAEVWMEKLEEVRVGDVRVEKFKAQQDYLRKIEDLSGRYTINKLPFNSPESDFAPSFYGDNLVFATARDTGTVFRKVNEWTNKSFNDLYMVKPRLNGRFSVPEKLPQTLNREAHETTTAFTKDGRTIYFTRNNFKKGKFGRGKDGVSRLKIYKAELKNGQWSDIAELPFNSDDHSVAHPALGPDGRKLYFASDMEGTLGKSDIFVVDIYEDGSFGTPINLGPKINTEARETFPFVTANNMLYFASDGHPGLGGLDIFAADLVDRETIKVVNVGKPINSLEDDFSFIIDEATKQGFFASNRRGGQGSDDIYAFTENEPLDPDCLPLVIKGSVRDQGTGEPLANTLLVLFDSESNIVAKTFSGFGGKFILEGPCQGYDYNLVASSEAYEKEEKTFPWFDNNSTDDVEISLRKVLEKPTVGTDLVSYLGLEPIYFALDSDEIRPDAKDAVDKVIAFMERYPDLKVEVQSHTDARADAGYNVDLSKRRAANTVDYLILKGIEVFRVSGQGFGKSRLINDCYTPDSCPDEKHQENRRSEIVVVE